jgi:hypothetical protein
MFPPRVPVFASGYDINWRLHPFGGPHFQVSLPCAPNVLHRALQFVILGHRYKMTPVFEQPNAQAHRAPASESVEPNQPESGAPVQRLVGLMPEEK